MFWAKRVKLKNKSKIVGIFLIMNLGIKTNDADTESATKYQCEQLFVVNNYLVTMYGLKLGECFCVIYPEYPEYRELH